MKSAGSPVLKDLVLLGGGHSHVAVLKRFGMRPLPGVRLTLICRDSHTPYSGMLPGLVAGHYQFDEAHIDLGPLSRFANARFYRSSATALDLSGNRVICDNRPPVPFDLLSINTGSTPDTADVPGATEAAIAVKPINAFLSRWIELETRILNHEGLFRLVVVGGGAGGIEILLSIQHRLNQILSRDQTDTLVEYHLFHCGDQILPTHNARVRRRFMKTLQSRGVTVHLGEPVTELETGRLQTLGGKTLEANEILWATDAGAPAWPREAGLDVDEKGFIKVNDRLQSTSHPFVFAAGDVASMETHRLPKSGVFAVRQGKSLERNLRHILSGRRQRPYRPQKRFLSLISTGDRFAVASRGQWCASGSALWWLKDRIDRRFMDRYNKLPDMTDPAERDSGVRDPGIELSAQSNPNAMRCGGCGSKIGASILENVLSSLPPVDRNDILIGLRDPDDAAVIEAASGTLTLHSIDSFRAPVDDPYLFGRITANHCLGDIYAMGGLPSTALAVATIPFGPEAKVADDLSQLMAGAAEVLDAADCALIGGHTSEGAELTLGFAINGTVDPSNLLRKDGLRPGDCLIITKPVGSGTLFAADMRARARRRWIDAALVHLTRSNRDSAACLREHGVRAATDVTGFGLLGHLHEMIRASNVSAILELPAIPVMDGAEDMVQAGIVSSLQSQNMEVEDNVVVATEVTQQPLYQLLFDPQTAGGLLAGVPQDRAEACLGALHALGDVRAAVIGGVVSSDGAAGKIFLNP